MSVRVKICGLSDERGMAAALEAGAAWVGLVFFPPSPRAVTPDRAATLARMVPRDVGVVGLTVDMPVDDCRRLVDAVPLTMLQMHGRETPEHVAAVRAATGRSAMKAIPVGDADDLAAAAAYESVCDWLLFDAKPPKDMKNALPGGNAVTFEWSLMRTHRHALPWMLAGGLRPETLAEAVAQSGATVLDVSSAVESTPGVKDPARIRAFLEAADAVPAPDTRPAC